MNYEILQIAIIIIGWLVIYFSNLRTQKEALKSDIHLKIYEGLYNKKNKLDKISIELGVSLFFMELTFSSMESVKVIESELKPWEYNLKAIEKWNEYVNTIDK